MDEYVGYFHRQDVPASMWEWRLFRDVKAVAGFSVVPKKWYLSTQAFDVLLLLALFTGRGIVPPRDARGRGA